MALCDWGAGSGVLAIAAARLGFDPVTALELDPRAAVVIDANARANGVEGGGPGAHDLLARPASLGADRPGQPHAGAAPRGVRAARPPAGDAGRGGHARALRGRMSPRSTRRCASSTAPTRGSGRRCSSRRRRDDPAGDPRRPRPGRARARRAGRAARRPAWRSVTSTPTPSNTRSTAPPGELPPLPDLRAAAGGALVDVSTSKLGDNSEFALAHLAPRRRGRGRRPDPPRAAAMGRRRSPARSTWRSSPRRRSAPARTRRRGSPWRC